MEKYKISVIVPTYNSGLFLNAFFDSMMYQSIGFENIEVIFVDDCSDDDYTVYLLNLFDENFSNVKSVFLDKNNGFPGKGRNIGLNLANSEYVIFPTMMIHILLKHLKLCITLPVKIIRTCLSLIIIKFFRIRVNL